MTIFYLDTEFNGHGGQLISLALVSPEGYTFYEICYLPEDIHPWVAEHVVPKLGRERVNYELMRHLFHDFIKKFENPTIIADWYADIQHFVGLLGGTDYGSSLDISCTLRLIKTPPAGFGPRSETPHNALADAIALMKWHHEWEPK